MPARPSRAAFIALGGLLLLAWAGYALLGEPQATDATNPHKSPQGVTQAKVRLPLRSFALNLDPATMADTESRKVATLLYSGLIAVQQDGAVEPRVAESWTQLDSQTWEFQLRPGVTFPDGTPVTAHKVVASLCAAMQADHIQSWSLASIAHQATPNSPQLACTGLSAPSPMVVRIREAESTPWLLEALSGPGGWVVDTAAEPGAYGLRPGTGPYLLHTVEPDQSVELAPRTSGAALEPKAAGIIFRYIPDAQLLANRYRNGDLHLVEVDSPQLLELVTDDHGELNAQGHLVRHPVDRVRIAIFNPKRMATWGLDAQRFQSLVDTYAQQVDQARLANVAKSLGTPLPSPFPPAPTAPPQRPRQASLPLPALQLTLITENDPYSDLLAANLPTSVGPVRIGYSTMEKGLFINALLKGTYDVALVMLEATHATPTFWSAFFTPGDPYAVFGRELDGLPAIDLTQPAGIEQASALIAAQGNWVGLLRESGAVVAASNLTGLAFTASGQLNFEQIGLAP